MGHDASGGGARFVRLRAIIIFVALIAACVVCMIFARRSKKAMSNDVALVLLAVLPPMVGNLILIASSDEVISTVGCYIYFIGIDFTVLAALRFSTNYCSIDYLHSKWHIAAVVLVAVDVIQLLANIFFGQAFSTEPIMVDGAPYYHLIPYIGQAFHRAVAYGLFFASLIIFIVKTARSPRIYVERYLVILIVMVVAGAWETFYIFSGSPIDRSMIAFGAFGIAVFYFSLIYKPMRLLDRMLARVVSDLHEAVFFFDRDGQCIYGNATGFELFGFKGNEDLDHCAEKVAEMTGNKRMPLSGEWAQQCSKGEGLDTRYYTLEYRTVFDDRDRKVGSSLNVRDRTDEEQDLRREKFLATHDRLTGLYNKEHLYEKARKLLEDYPTKRFIAVGQDIKDFKIINDIYGKEYGDRVLRKIADTIRSKSHGHDVYGRLTADKFGFIVRADMFNPELTARELSEMTFEDEGINYPIVIHMGVYEINDLDLPISVMFDRAFMAIASIKNEYQQHLAFYSDSMREDMIWNQKITGQLDRAITEGQIQPYLQPMVDSSGQAEGAEVLVRWIHPEEGFLSPARFIPIFEQNGLIAKLDTFMWESACKILKEWEEQGVGLFLSVNISPKDFYFIDVYETIRELVARYEIDPAKLRLEITETVMMSDLENRLKIIEDLRSYGFLVEMDDFGSGYSSLNMLKDIPVDVLKIDMMFLYKTKDQAKAQTILQTIINLSGELGIPSVTEGVETAEQLSMLVEMGCRLFQGYFFARPMPLAEFEAQYANVA